LAKLINQNAKILNKLDSFHERISKIEETLETLKVSKSNENKDNIADPSFIKVLK
jgi:hypothetical protein